MKEWYLPFSLEKIEANEVLFDVETTVTASTSNDAQRENGAPKLEHGKLSCVSIKKSPVVET